MSTPVFGPTPPAEIAVLFDGFNGSPGAYSALARALAPVTQDWPEVRMAVLATCTTEVLRPFLIVEAARRGMKLNLWFGPFGQMEQQVLNPQSELFSFQPDVVWFMVALEDWAEQECLRFATLDTAAREQLRTTVVDRIGTLTAAARQNCRASLLWCNFAPPQMPGTTSLPGLCDAGSLTSFSQSLNVTMGQSLAAVPDTWLFDLAGAMATCGSRHWTDTRMALLARIPFSTEAQITLAKSLTRTLRALRHPPRKCLVLDLDNTLWGGVLGEVGLSGLKLGNSFPGNAYLAFQKTALALRHRGVLLAVASKNNEADALEALINHPDCLLRPADFAALQIHWEDKATSLRRIAATLNIGTDSLVFFDDNPTERAWVRSQLPEVAVIEAPASPGEYAAALDASELFDTPLVTADDLQRVAMYQQQSERSALMNSSGSIEDFLQSLEMKTQIGKVDAETLERVTQLLAKTNQFNLTTRRHTQADLADMLAKGAVALWMRVADRFGDNGLTGVAIAVPCDEPDGWRIDTFLLSCRVMGRHLETGLLGALAQEIGQRGGQTLSGEYIPTAKNPPVKDFYSQHSFTTQDDSGQHWQRPLFPLDSYLIPDYLHLTYVS